MLEHRRRFLSFVGAAVAAIALPFKTVASWATPKGEVMERVTGVVNITSPGKFIWEPALKTVKLRVWKLGNLEYKILPTQQAIDKLSGMLASWDGKTDLDIIWGPELEVLEFDVPSDSVDAVLAGNHPTIRIVKPDKNIDCEDIYVRGDKIPESFACGAP